jgi:hypothetical protein
LARFGAAVTLSHEISCNPADLLLRLPDNGLERMWHVVQTHARQEKLLASSLRERGVPFCLPLLRRTLSYRGRNAISWMPVYPGYLFALLTGAEREYCLSTCRAAAVIEVLAPQQLLCDLRAVLSSITAGTNSYRARNREIEQVARQGIWKQNAPSERGRADGLSPSNAGGF